MTDSGKQLLKVGGYVKLAKLWERNAQKAIAYHNAYYAEMFGEKDSMDLVGVYVDITGQKDIKKRPEMLRLLKDCVNGKVNCIATQTKAYLAANNEEFFYLIFFLFTLNPPVGIITEDRDYNINTYRDEDNQTEALFKVSCDFISLKPRGYEKWNKEIRERISTLGGTE